MARTIALSLSFAVFSYSSLAIAADGAWSELPVGVAYEGLGWPAGIYDPVADQIVIYGGHRLNTTSEENWSVWTLAPVPGNSWIRPDQGPGTFQAQKMTATYDPQRHRMLVFGGYRFNSPTNQVWSCSLSVPLVWRQILPAGDPPPARADHSAIYDPVRDRLVIFGGSSNDVWALSLSGTPTWTQILPSGPLPPARAGHLAAYDPVRDRMLIFGGQALTMWPGIYAGPLGDVWALNFKHALEPDPRTSKWDRLRAAPAWSQLSPSGSPPSPRAFVFGAYDGSHDRLVFFGGSVGDYDHVVPSAETWQLDLSGGGAWSQVASIGPPPRYGGACVLDAVGGRMLIAYGSGWRGDTWSLSLSDSPTWSRVHDGFPGSGECHTAIYDTPRDRMITYGFRGSLWSRPMVGRWVLLEPSGTPPTSSVDHSAIYDPVRERMIVFGGDEGAGPNNGLWALDLVGALKWTQFAPSGTPPPPRSDHTAVYDPVYDRMIVFGGRADTTLFNDVWELSFSGGNPAWAQLVPSGTPPGARHGHVAIYDPPRQRMLVYGGISKVDDGRELWELSLGPAGTSAWGRLLPTGAPPLPEHGVAIYDPVRDRLVVDVYSKTYALPLVGPPVWTRLVPTGAAGSRLDHSAIYDPLRDRLIVHGGNDGAHLVRNYGSAYALTFGATTSVDDRVAGRSQAMRVLPNPGRSTQAFVLEIAEGSTIRSIEVVSVSGQRVWQRDLSDLGPGIHRVVWDGRDRRGGSAPPGVYYARTHGSAGPSSARFVRLE